jgi:glycosyltransferase involved in cell wall biosynthesis
MRIAMISPYSRGPVRGNITTVNRIARYLREAGCEVLVQPLDAVTPEEMERCLQEFLPDLVHAFHARYCGEVAAGLAGRLSVPMMITTTGSDICDVTLRDHSATAVAMADADAVACFSKIEADEVAEHFPDVSGRIAIVPQGVEPLVDSKEPVCGIPEDDFVLLLPAALRPVKNVEFAVRALAGLQENFKKLRLVIAGGDLDHKYASAIRSLLSRSPWATWLGEVPYSDMGNLYRRADVVLNCSSFEGMPNSLMEAMALGRPVLAADIPGNRSLVKNGETGWLYRDEADFKEKLSMITADPVLRQECGARASKFMRLEFSPQSEAETYLKLYRSIT